MKSILPISAIFLLLFACKNSKQQDITYDPIVLKAKETSLYADQVNWQEVNQTFVNLTAGKQSVEERKEGLQYLLNSLGDKHGAFRQAKDFSIVASYTGPNQGVDNRDADFVNTVINDISATFSYELMENGIGYLKVVGIGPGDIKQQADEIRKGLTDLKSQGVDRWILDLRYNGGGNMEPMIAGLAPLIGEGFIGGAVDKNGELSREYQINNGQFFNTERLVCEMEADANISPTEKVAVLLSRYTASSGELVAVAFKGRENTRFIGEETAGYTTGNGYDPIDDELIMMISQDVFADRNRNTYESKVGVDEMIPFQPELGQAADPQLLRAIEWLGE